MDIQGSPVIIDTDMSMGSIAALALLSRHGANIRLVTTVYGLCTPDKAPALARCVLASLGKPSVPVVAGLPAAPDGGDPIGQIWWCKEYRQVQQQAVKQMGFDTDAMAQDDDTLDQAGVGVFCRRQDAAEAILAEAAAAGGVVLLALGALTNVAAAAARSPSAFRRNVRRVVSLCPRPEHSEWSAQSDCPWNIGLDITAARRVFAAGVPTTLISESDCFPTEGWVVSQEKAGNSPPKTKEWNAVSIIRWLATAFPDCIQVEPVAAAYLLAPRSFSLSPCKVSIASDGILEYAKCASGPEADPGPLRSTTGDGQRGSKHDSSQTVTASTNVANLGLSPQQESTLNRLYRSCDHIEGCDVEMYAAAIKASGELVSHWFAARRASALGKKLGPGRPTADVAQSIDLESFAKLLELRERHSDDFITIANPRSPYIFM